jgi:hypothetical protein
MVHEEGLMNISEQGKLQALECKGTTRKKVLAAMKEMEAEIDSNKGVYPYNSGRISQQEVLRRASLSAAALQKSTHEDLRNEVNAWLGRVTKKAITGAKSVRRSVMDRVDETKTDLDRIMQQWAEFELEYIDAQQALSQKNDRIVELERDIEHLRSLAPGRTLTVVPNGKSGRRK